MRIPPIPENETWQIGWIQACTDMVFLNTYGPYGVSSWEFPELKTGENLLFARTSQCQMSLSDVVVRCRCQMSLSDVIARCHCQMSLSDVIVRCDCQMSLSDVIVRCHCQMSLSDVIVRCHCQMSLLVYRVA